MYLFVWWSGFFFLSNIAENLAFTLWEKLIYASGRISLQYLEEHFVHVGVYDYACVSVFSSKVYLTVTWASGERLRESEVGRNRAGQVE